MRFVKPISLVIILLVGALLVVLSFQPRVRFADPAPAELGEAKRNYSCYHDRIYSGDSSFDALFFGASKTYFAMDAAFTMQAYEQVSGDKLSLFAFSPPRSNPEIAYFFFRDYLAHNPSPKVALFSLTSTIRQPPPTGYMHPYFANLAPPYLYADVLASWSFVKYKMFAVSNFLRLLIRHLDLSLSRLLVADYIFTVPAGNNCEAELAAMGQPVADMQLAGSFDELLDSELEELIPNFEHADIGSTGALLQTYEGNVGMTKTIGNFEKHRTRLSKSSFWIRHGRTEMSVDYYRRIVALGKAHNVKIGFYFMPNLLAFEPREEDVKELAAELGAPVYTLPHWYTRVSFHHQRDSAHITDAFRPVYSAWFASLVRRLEEG